MALSFGLLSCSSGPHHGAAIGAPDGGDTMAPPTVGACDTPNQGCACDTENEVVDCGQVERVSGDYISCSMGHRTCKGAEWGACIGDSISTTRLVGPGARTLGLGSGVDCPDNPCDPYCRLQTDDPSGLMLPTGIGLAGNGGLQIAPQPGVDGAGSCTSMTVTPPSQTVKVTGLGANPLVAEYFKGIDKTALQISSAWVPFAKVPASNINLDSDSGSSGIPGLPSTFYTVRWTGSITTPTTESYTFCTVSDDGARVWIDGNLLVDQWRDQSSEEHCSAPYASTANVPHSFRYEYYQGEVRATAKLEWSSPTMPMKQIVPPSAFAVSGVMTNITPSFTVNVSPPDCVASPMPAWTLDRLDLATIDANGKVSLISGVTGPITATAYLGSLHASGVVNVVVDIKDLVNAPANSAPKLDLAATGTDPASIVYPYDQTVYPIGLRPPVIQWDTGGTAATAVKVSLTYPATGTATFSWSEVIPESSPAQAVIPAQVWKFFEQTAKGQAAAFSVQRLIAGTARPAITRTLTFSSAPVRGRIYYTQYHRNLDANEMVVDPGSSDGARPAFGTTDGCPVCHTLSANGNVFATSSRYGLENNNYNGQILFSASLGGVSSVNQTTGLLTNVGDFVADPPRRNYTGGSTDWRGFAWAPLTPDGTYALVANNVWGNTKENLVGIDTNTRRVNTPNWMLSGGAGTGLLAQYYSSADFSGTPWKRFEPQLNFDFGTGKPGGLITSDFSVRRSGLVQAYFTEPYLFEVTSTSGDEFTLTVGASSFHGFGPVTLSGTVNMTAGALATFELLEVNAANQSNVQVYWSSPSTPRALIPQSQLFPPAAEPMHGANVAYRDDATTTTVSRVEPDLASDYAANAPAPGIAIDNWRSTWDAQIESPYAGKVRLCVDADDAVAVTLDGTALASLTSAASLTACSTETTLPNWTAGQKHTVHIVHHDGTGSAKMVLSYKYGPTATPIQEVIPSANITPLDATVPTNGLTATFYDLPDFNVQVPASQVNPRAFQRIDPNIDFDWAGGRPNYSVISQDGDYSARWTGAITMPCAGTYLFRSDDNIDDGGRLWIDDTRVMGRWDFGQLAGVGTFGAGAHDFKFDFHQNGGNSVAKLQWSTPCSGSPGFVTIPSTAFTPNASYGRSTGFQIDGGDNGNGTSYWIWNLSTSTTPTAADVTGASNWGLLGKSMMVPSFSPNAKKLVFIDGDSATGSGWRKGLSTFDFDQAGKAFTNRRQIVNNWPNGDVLKWPTFESDSHSVIYQSTVPGDSCCRNDWKKYGYMGPTNYYEDPGRLWSVDTTAATPTPVALTKLNSGERPKDVNKSYQASMLPVSAGGFRWVVFTSTRPYGNTLNLPGVETDFSNTATYANSSYAAMTNTSDIQSQLWVAAIDDAASGTTDRSHPAFWLPSQNFSTTAASGYINERGYWALEACHPAGTDAAASCEVDEDCCGATAMPKAAACRLDTPIQNPPTRHCRALPVNGNCAGAGASCGAPTDCCDGLACLGAVCSTPPAVLPIFAPANFERIYKADCPDGTKPAWRFFDWKSTTPATDSKLEFYAETEPDPSSFLTLPVAPIAVSSDSIVKLATQTGATLTDWIGSSVSLALDNSPMKLKSQLYLKVTVRFIPNVEKTASPTLTNWRQSYSCLPAE